MHTGFVHSRRSTWMPRTGRPDNVTEIWNGFQWSCQFACDTN